MNKNKTKLLMAAVMLTLSVVLLAGASLAWFTMSTSPEVTGMQVTLFTDRALLVARDELNAEGELTFDQSISLGDLFEDLAPLKPISTADGVNWFIPEYHPTTGELLSPAEFKLANIDVNANVKMVYADGSPLSEADAFIAGNNGYFVYCDFWLKTEYEDGCDVTLSAPNIVLGNRDNAHLESWETDLNHRHHGVFGSYALAMYEKNEDEATNTANPVYRIDNNVQTALRIGFIIYDENGNPEDRFVIYEPNADQRSSAIGKPAGGELGNYVHGYEIETDQATGEPTNYLSDTYIPTRPIGLGTDGKGTLVDIAPDDLIVQLAGKWDLEKVKKKVMAGETPNSMDVDTFGRFVKNTSALLAQPNYYNFKTTTTLEMDLGSSSTVVHLGSEEAKKIRMFIWLEGQDPDCWNDIASGSFVVNLEFAAQTDE